MGVVEHIRMMGGGYDGVGMGLWVVVPEGEHVEGGGGGAVQHVAAQSQQHHEQRRSVQHDLRSDELELRSAAAF